jgi:hypothetical protein
MRSGTGLAAVFAGVVALWAVAADAQQEHSTEWRTKVPERRAYAAKDAARMLSSYSRCVADRRYDRARALVLSPYASSEQADAADKITKADDDWCLQGYPGETRMTFRAELLAGSVAQALVLKEYPDLPAVIGASKLNQDEAAQAAQLHAVETFGRCVVQRNPTGALALFVSLPASPEEKQAIGSLVDDLSPCLAVGSTMQINGLFLRNATGVAAYRLAQQIQPRGRSASSK